MSDKSVSILGCGWMGLPLAERLVHLGFSVKGATTTPAKTAILSRLKIEPFLLEAAPELSGQGRDLFFQSDILFLNIPFRRNLEDPTYYREQIGSVISCLKESSVKFVIFAGSTSVYPDAMEVASEDVPLRPDNPRAKVLQEIERTLLDDAHFDATVIRFAGLYGGERLIGRLLAGKKGLDDGKSPVNLIHLDDCVEIVVQVIKQDIRGEIVNACSDGHPNKQEVYTKAAHHYGWEPPQFTDRQRQPTRVKIVSNAKLKKKLNYIFKYPDPGSFCHL
jgi:nucleoside-diphosphate-sugar epimerase